MEHATNPAFDEPQRLPISFWWALVSVALMAIGAFGPWETVLGTFTDSGTGAGPGWHVLVAAAAAAIGLALFARRRNALLSLLPLLAGGWAVAVTAVNLYDIGTYDGLEVARWGLYAALVGSCSIVLAAFGLALESSSREPKIRRPWLVFVLAIATFGLYHLYWYYVVNRELKDHGVGKHPIVSLLAQFPGALLIVPPFVSWWRFYTRIRDAEDRADSPERVEHGIGIALYVLGFILLPVELIYAQRHLNALWRTVAATAPPSDPFPYTGYAPEPSIAPES